VKDGTQSAGLSRDAYEVLEVRPDASQTVVNAAFRALAAVHHPDAQGGSNRRMAELNAAYALVRTTDLRAAYDKLRGRSGAGSSIRSRQAAQAAPSSGAAGSSGASPGAAQPKRRGVLDFGRYEGWSIADLARRDPDYLRWLRRHSSGIRFRNEIDATLEVLEPQSKQPAETSRLRRR
jgi:curved DNA-binding protein CbpA